jgi:hypothetical protein
LVEHPTPGDVVINGRPKKTIGSWVGIIYESLRDGRLYDKLMEALAEGLEGGVVKGDGQQNGVVVKGDGQQNGVVLNGDGQQNGVLVNGDGQQNGVLVNGDGEQNGGVVDGAGISSNGAF